MTQTGPYVIREQNFKVCSVICVAVGKQKDGLISHGSFNPVHSHHVLMMNMAKQKMEDKIREWVRGLPSRCVALVNFAGHAVEHNAENLLLPTDAPSTMLPGELRYKCVSLNLIMSCLLDRLDKESLIIVLLDCCREETLSRGLQSLGRAPGQRGLGRVALSDPDSAAVFVGYAAAPGMSAMERPERS